MAMSAASEGVTPSSTGASNDECLAFMRDYSPQKRRVDEENGVLRSFIKRAKNSGVPTRAALFVNRLSKLSREEAVEEIRQIVRLAGLRQIIQPTQLDVLGNIDLRVSNRGREDMDLAEAEDSGYRAGREGATAEDNPYPIGSETAQRWGQARSRGESARSREAGPTGRQALANRQGAAATRGNGAATPKAKAKAKGKGKAKAKAGSKKKAAPMRPRVVPDQAPVS